MKEKIISIMPAVMILFVSLVIFAPATAKSAPLNKTANFTIQTGSFLTEPRALFQYHKLLENLPADQRPDLRIEFYEPYFAVRIGSFADVFQARAFRAEIRDKIPGAILVQANINLDRLIRHENNQQAPLENNQQVPVAGLAKLNLIARAESRPPSESAVQVELSAPDLTLPPSQEKEIAVQEKLDRKSFIEPEVIAGGKEELPLLPADDSGARTEKPTDAFDRLASETWPAAVDKAPPFQAAPPQANPGAARDNSRKPLTTKIPIAEPAIARLPALAPDNPASPPVDKARNQLRIGAESEVEISRKAALERSPNNQESGLQGESAPAATTRKAPRPIPPRTSFHILIALLLIILLIALRLKIRQAILPQKSPRQGGRRQASLNPVLLKFKNEIIKYFNDHHPADIHEVVTKINNITGHPFQAKDISTFIKALRSF